MTKHINLHKNYTVNQRFYQLKLPLEIDCIIPDNDSVRLLSQFVEEMNLENLYSTYMQTACQRDINFMYLMENSPVPDHATFARFRSIHFAPCAEEIMAKMSDFLYDISEISGKAIFIDGTKIEACANKYTFVWKKAVTKNQAKLLIKLAEFVSECEEIYGIKLVYQNQVKIKHVKNLRKKFYALKQEEFLMY